MVSTIENRPAWGAPRSSPIKTASPARTLSRVTLRNAKSNPDSKTPQSGSATSIRPNPSKPTVKLQSSLKQPDSGTQRPRRVLTPMTTRRLNVPKRAVVPSEPSPKSIPDQPAEMSLEDRIRSALSNTRKDTRTRHPASIKSVRWDPAIIAAGPISPSPKPTTASTRVSDISVSRQSTVTIEDDVIHTLRRLKSKDRDTLRKFLDELKALNTEDLPIATSRPEKRKARSLKECSSSRLNPEAQPFSRRYTTMKAQIAQRKANAYLGKESLAIPRKRPHFPASDPVPSRNPPEPTWVNIFNPPEDMANYAPVSKPHSLPYRVVHAPAGFNLPPRLRVLTDPSGNFWNETPVRGHAPSMPFEMPNAWNSDTLSFYPSFLEGQPSVFSSEDNTGPTVSDPSSGYKTDSSNHTYVTAMTSNEDPMTSHVWGYNNIPYMPPVFPVAPPEPIWLPMPMPMPLPQSYGFQGLPQTRYWINTLNYATPEPGNMQGFPTQPTTIPPPRRPSQTARRPRRPSRGPFVDVGPGFAPPEDDQGREAHAIEPGWAKSLLRKFREKYPQTGRVKKGTPSPNQMRHAAAIQQHLEFILFQEKERRAKEQCSSDEPPPSYKSHERGSGVKIEFSEDESSVIINDEATTDEIITLDQIAREGADVQEMVHAPMDG